MEATSRTLLPRSITSSQADVRPRCFLLSFFGFRRLRPRDPSFFAFMTPQKILRNCPHCGQKWLWWGVHDPTGFSCPDFGAPKIGPKPLKSPGVLSSPAFAPMRSHSGSQGRTRGFCDLCRQFLLGAVTFSGHLREVQLVLIALRQYLLHRQDRVEQ